MYCKIYDLLFYFMLLKYLIDMLFIDILLLFLHKVMVSYDLRIKSMKPL